MMIIMIFEAAASFPFRSGRAEVYLQGMPVKANWRSGGGRRVGFQELGLSSLAPSKQRSAARLATVTWAS